MLLVGQLSQAIVRNIRAALGQRPPLQERKHGAANLLKNFVALRSRRNDVKLDVHVWLEGKKVCHPQ